MTAYAITGVSGYVGQLLAAKLAAGAGDRVIGIDLVPPAGLSGVSFRRCDIRSPQLAAILQKERVDTLVHLAFYTHPEGDEAVARSVNVEGTRNVLAATAQAGVRRVVLASSVAAYGSHPDNAMPMREDAPLRPNGGYYYSWHKAEQERLMGEFVARHPDVSTIVLRPCVIIGPHIDNPTGASLRQKVLIYIKGDRTPIQFIHEDDAVEAFYLAAKSDRTGVFNVAGEGTMTYPEIARVLDKKLLVLPYAVLAALATLGKWLGLSPVSARTLRFIRNPMVVDGAKFAAAFSFRPHHSQRQAIATFASHSQRS